MVNFEDAQPVPQSAAIGISIQSRAEQYNLTHTAFNSGCQSILREARSHGDENPHPASRGSLRSLARYGLGLFAQDTQSKWIGEDATLFQNLMSGTVSGCGPGRPAWLSQLHE
jgi:hypothetical protein